VVLLPLVIVTRWGKYFAAVIGDGSKQNQSQKSTDRSIRPRLASSPFESSAGGDGQEEGFVESGK
jgi:hypothetical protein